MDKYPGSVIPAYTFCNPHVFKMYYSHKSSYICVQLTDGEMK